MAELDPVVIDADVATGLPSMSGREMRQMMEALQAGVFSAGDLKVTTGAGLSVNVAAGLGLVQSSVGGIYLPGKYLCANDAVKNSAAFEAGAIPSNASPNPRLDAVVARVYDHALDGSGARKWRLHYVVGTPTAAIALGGTLPALPTSSLLLAEVLTPGSNPASIPAGNIRDRRPWARGTYRRIARTANAGATNDYTTTSTSAVALDATNLGPRIECSGAPMRARLRAVAVMAANQLLKGHIGLDGVAVDTNYSEMQNPVASANDLMFEVSWEFVPSAGSHIIAPYWYVSTGTGTLVARSTIPLVFTVEEIVRQNADNT